MKAFQGRYIHIIRGVFAIVRGVLLLTQKAMWNVVQYMGKFWYTIGLPNNVWARSRGREIHFAHWSLVAGILGVVAGGIALLQPLLGIYFSTLIIVILLGALVVVIGPLHIIGGLE